MIVIMNSENAALERRIETAAGPDAALLSFERMPGGHSGVTHLAKLERDGSVESVVVKSAPPGRKPIGRHDVLRQARVIEALSASGGVPVSTVRFAEDGDPPFFAGELLAGIATEPVISEPEEGESAELISARWDVAIELLALLHSIPLEDLGLTDEAPRTPREELETWTKTIESARLEDPSDAEALRDEMRRTAPETSRNALVHGDFRLGNVMFDGAAARGLIDWEIWSVGNPLVDLGWFVHFTDPETYPGISREVPGTPSGSYVVERYLQASGQADVDPSWFLALGCFKLAAIQGHNRRRHVEGRHHDPFAEQLGPSIDRLLRHGLLTLEESF